MFRTFAMSILSLALMGLGSAAASETDPAAAPATFVLQVASNLECESLRFELIETDTAERHSLTFGSGAFSAVQLRPGRYAFGPVSCEAGKYGTETFDQLGKTLAPMSLLSGQAYYGGKVILESAPVASASGEPDVVNNCIRGTGRFRKEPNDDCRDGIGIETDSEAAHLVNFYLPAQSDEDVSRVRSAFKASPEQLLYMPLETRAD